MGMATQFDDFHHKTCNYKIYSHGSKHTPENKKMEFTFFWKLEASTNPPVYLTYLKIRSKPSTILEVVDFL